MRDRAYRRHQERRIKRRAQHIAKDIWKYWGSQSTKFINSEIEWFRNNANHLKACSCTMCGNPRKHWGERTKQEKQAEITEKEYLHEINELLHYYL